MESSHHQNFLYLLTGRSLLRHCFGAALSVFVGLTCFGQSNYATPYVFSTLAGSVGSVGSNDGTGSAARFQAPQGVAVDGSGNVFVGDFSNQTIRKVTSGGVVTTFAGTAGATGSTDATGSAARFSGPAGVAIDSSGNIYVADYFNHTIRKITSAGVVTTLAGTAGAAGSTDATGSAARFNYPAAVAVDSSGNVYVADSGNHTIRKITSAGVVSTLAGVAGSSGSADGTGVLARFNTPFGVAVDGSGNVYVGDTMNHTIRKVTSGGTVTTFAGTAGSPGSADGTGAAARFQRPEGVAVDGALNVYVADYANHAIRKISSAGIVTTLAGLGGTFGTADGTGSAARFYFPTGVSVDGSGSVFVADNQNFTIRKVTALAVVTTLAGTPPYGFADGTGSAAGFNSPAGVATDSAGVIYVSDTYNHTIRKVTTAGVVTTLAGSAGTLGSADGTGSAARFNLPQGLAVDSSGNVYVADYGNHVIRKITSGGVVTTFAGTAGSSGSTDGTGSGARFNNPRGVAVDGAGNVYVADFGNHTIRKITSGGVVTTLAGLAGNLGSSDGTGSAARFTFPHGIASDTAGNLYVADTANCTIRAITPSGVVTTIAGTAGAFGSADGTGAAARFDNPDSVAVNSAGTVFVGDFANDTIRKISVGGLVTTIAGLAGNAGSADGASSYARFNLPQGIAIDGMGTLCVADTNNHEIRRGVEAVRNDFTGDGQPDILWTNTTSGVRGFWEMNGTSYAGWVGLDVVTPDWRIAGTADFNGDGKTDILWQNTSTGVLGFWLMNGTNYASWVGLDVVSTDWRVAAVADFNGDGQPDIVWENTTTGVRGVWLMNGTSYAGWVGLGVVTPDWRIVGAADFNGDGQPDILWQNTNTGVSGFWVMNGTSYVSWVGLEVLTTDWQVGAIGDFNGDGNTDILWQNTTSGVRGFWLMNGTSYSSWVGLDVVTTDWQIAP